LHLEMNHNIRIPGFSNDPPIQQNSLAIATGAPSTSGGGAGGPAGGGKRADASTAAASGGGGSGPKRSARLAAVQQAKRESRLL